MANEYGYTGTQQPGDNSDEYGSQVFVIRQILSRVNTSTLVKIVAVTNSGGLSAVGFVDVQPLINQVDGANNATPNAIVYNVPYFRIQGGTDAIIIDPKIGDIGIAVFADHDISTVSVTKAQSNPGSGRRFGMGDAMYLGGVLNGVPTQYVQFSATGINITSPNSVTITAPIATVIATGSASITAPSITLGASGQTLLSFVTSAFTSLFNSHTHADPQGGITSAPSPQMGATHVTTTVKGG